MEIVFHHFSVHTTTHLTFCSRAHVTLPETYKFLKINLVASSAKSVARGLEDCSRHVITEHTSNVVDKMIVCELLTSQPSVMAKMRKCYSQVRPESHSL